MLEKGATGGKPSISTLLVSYALHSTRFTEKKTLLGTKIKNKMKNLKNDNSANYSHNMPVGSQFTSAAALDCCTSTIQLPKSFDLILMAQNTRFMGLTRGPPGADRTQVGPILAPWTLLSGGLVQDCSMLAMELLQSCAKPLVWKI